MTRPLVQPAQREHRTETTTLSTTPRAAARLVGQVVYLYAFDIAYELKSLPPRVMGQVPVQFEIGASKRSPRQMSFYRPQLIHLPPIERLGPRGHVRLERTIKFLPVGALSIMVRVPFEVGSVDELVAFHDLRFADGTYLYDEVRALADEVRRELRPYLVKPTDALGDEEAYTVFCVNAPLLDEDGQTVSTESWAQANRRAVASLLTEEPDPSHLSEQEADESTGRWFSYYERDVVIVDWDAALVVDEPRAFDEILYIMELANLQLAELEAYDRILDAATERSYRDLRARRFRSWAATGVQRDLREIRIDLARLSDELGNITKFFGDWHLARIYQGLAARFHLGEWHRSIDEKLKTLDDLYQILRADQNNRWMLILEATIVLLFIVDLLAIFVWN